ncbi:MAG: SMC family ATPase [Desulfurococcaceae archaeon]
MKNIRSYVNETIVFPPKGITCIYGDVGSGKTSILMAISYALFGSQMRSRTDPIDAYSYPRAEDLLRINEYFGAVRIAFKHRGKIYVVERGIRKEKNSFSDTGGYLWILDENSRKILEQRRLTSNELKQAILEILGFRELYRGIISQRKPYLYTNAIYVPQFNISESITLGDEDRNRIINTALGLEKYVNIPRNIDKLINYIKNSILKEIKGREDTLLKQLKLYDRNRIRNEISKYEEDMKRIGEEIKVLEKRKEELRVKINDLRLEHEKLTNRLSELKIEIREIQNSEKKLVDLKAKIEKIKDEVKDLSLEVINKLIAEFDDTIQNLNMKIEELNNKLSIIDEKLQKTISRRGVIEGEKNVKLSRRKELMEIVEDVKKLVEQGVCPTCKQKISRDYGEKLISSYLKDLDDLNKEIESLENKLQNIIGEIENLKAERKSILEELNKLRIDLNNVVRNRDDVSRKRDLLIQLEDYKREVQELENRVREKSRVVEEADRINSEIIDIEKRISIVENEYREVDNKLFDLHKEYTRLLSEKNNLIKKLEELERLEEEYREVVKNRERYESYIDFLGDLENLVSEVEKYVRSRAYEFFREVFIDYFNKLMEGYEIVSVDVDQNFRPEIKIKIGFAEHAVNQPSGGQFISVSLAYRLALNTLFRALHKDFKDMVLILDEPTVGFSPERVGKLRELLREISGRDNQAIVVTHDRNLLDIGDCKIKLSIDPSKNTTRVEYEECFCEGIEWNEYMEAIANLLKNPQLFIK